MTPRACFLLPRASDAWQPHRRGRSGGVADAIGRSIDRSIRQNESVDRLIDSISASPRNGVDEDDDADSRDPTSRRDRATQHREGRRVAHAHTIASPPRSHAMSASAARPARSDAGAKSAEKPSPASSE